MSLNREMPVRVCLNLVVAGPLGRSGTMENRDGKGELGNLYLLFVVYFFKSKQVFIHCLLISNTSCFFN